MTTVFRLPLRVIAWERVGYWHPKYVMQVEPVRGDSPLMSAIAGLGSNPKRMEATITVDEKLWLEMTKHSWFRLYDKNPRDGVELWLDAKEAATASLPTPRSLEMHLAEVNGNSYAPGSAGKWAEHLVVIRSPTNELRDKRLIDTAGLLVRIDSETYETLKAQLPRRCYANAGIEMRT